MDARGLRDVKCGCRRLYARLMIGISLIVLWGVTMGGMNACTKKNPQEINCAMIAEQILASQKNTPDGQLYDSQISEGERRHLGGELVSGLYGSTARGWLMDGDNRLLNDMAMYLNDRGHPFEIAVLRCKDTSDIHGELGSILGTCQNRLSEIRQAWQGTAYESYVAQGVVTWMDDYVLFLVCDDVDVALEAARDAIG